MIKLCYFNQDTLPPISIRSIVFTASLLVAL